MDFVRHHDGQLLKPICPVSKEGVRPLRGRHDDVELFERWVDRIVISYTDPDSYSECLEFLEVIVLLRGEGTKRDNVQCLASAKYRRQNREVGHERLAACGRDRKNDILAEECWTDRIRLGRIELLNSLPLEDFHDSSIEPEVRDTHPQSDARRPA